MPHQYESVPLINNIKASRFEMIVDGTVSFVDYKQKPHIMALLHTEVPQAMEGKGIAAALVEKTLLYMEAHQLKLISLCPYITTYLKRHPQWNRILEEQQ